MTAIIQEHDFKKGNVSTFSSPVHVHPSPSIKLDQMKKPLDKSDSDFDELIPLVDK